MIYSLFFGGYYPINVESIILTSTNDNFNKIITALCYFDTLTSGMHDKYTKKRITGEHVKVLKGLFNYFSGDQTMRFNPYMLQTFQAFVKAKTSIKIHFTYFSDPEFTEPAIRELIINNTQQSEHVSRRTANDDANLLNPQILTVFTAIKTITLEATQGPSRGPQGCFTMSFLKLLSLIKNTSVQKVIIDEGGSYEKRWIMSLWNASSSELIEEYRKSNFDIQYVQTSSTTGEMMVTRK